MSAHPPKEKTADWLAMTAGAITEGRRRAPNTRPWNLQPGDYMLRKGSVWVRLPDGTGPCNLTTWDLTVHEDGTITLSPSILDRGPGGWHGYLERGIWREV